MMQVKCYKTLTFIGGSSILVLTFFRENMLLAINAVISHQQVNRAYSYWFANFFRAMSSNDLIKWKWGLTLFFALVIALITIFSLYNWFRHKWLLNFLVVFYGLVFTILALGGITGFLIGEFEAIYFFLRLVIGLVQSPIPFFVFFVLFYFTENIKESQHKSVAKNKD